MAVTYLDLKSFINEKGVDNDNLIQSCFEEAVVLVTKYVGTVLVTVGSTTVAAPRPVPTEILDRAYLEVGADLWNRRKAPNGIVNQQFSTVDGIGSTPFRISRDPLAAAYKILGRWVPPF